MIEHALFKNGESTILFRYLKGEIDGKYFLWKNQDIHSQKKSRYIHFLGLYLAHRVKFSLHYYNKPVYFYSKYNFNHATIF